ncbi:MAG: 30S ribosomal protein S7, partial [Candidatus Kerfeldbacteria bacterium]|nr:30S ribosomal protein S7 [Candidatus Kerfeldbacteria bacterium]
MRGKRAPKRPIQPDPKYHSTVIAKFTNSILRNGKKLVAQRIVYTALDTVAERTKQDPLDVFNQALKNVTPTVEVRSRRIGGANYQIPVEVRG